MANQIFVNPNPYGVDNTQRSILVKGTIVLAGAAVSTGEPLNWGNGIGGIPYNIVNFAGNGVHGSSSALVTGLSASGGVITVTAANNFNVGQNVTFASCTTVFGAKLNGLTFPVASVTPGTSFTIASAITGTTTSSEVGMAVSGGMYMPLSNSGSSVSAAVTSLAVTSTSGGVPAYITVTSANNFLPGAPVTFSGLSTVLGLKMNGVQFEVVSSTGTAFIVYSTLTGSAGSDTGTATGFNCPQPYLFHAWSALASGYSYQYNTTTGCLFAMQVPASSALTSAASLSALAAAAYPAGVLGDVISYEAMFAKQR